MPQVKELKELGVAGSATNEQAGTEAGWRILNIASYLPLFMSVTGYKQRSLQVRSKNCYRLREKMLQVTSKECYRLQAKNVTDFASVTCNRSLSVTRNRLLPVTCNSKPVTGGNCVDSPTI